MTAAGLYLCVCRSNFTLTPHSTGAFWQVREPTEFKRYDEAVSNGMPFYSGYEEKVTALNQFLNKSAVVKTWLIRFFDVISAKEKQILCVKLLKSKFSKAMSWLRYDHDQFYYNTPGVTGLRVPTPAVSEKKYFVKAGG